MKIDIITIHPKMFSGPFSESIIKRAQDNDLVKINVHDLRSWASGKHKKVDDTPFGGGGGMVLMIEPIHKAIEELRTKDTKVLAMTAKGETFTQSKAKLLATSYQLLVLCGHYEGFDQRILDNLVDEQISIGNYVLTGGEIPAMVVVDSVTRLLPGVLGNEESPKSDSFYEDDQTKQYPVYTKPAEYDLNGKVLKVPDILQSGDHEKIRQWRESNSLTN